MPGVHQFGMRLVRRGFQFRRAFLHAFITHRFMFRRIGFDLRAIQCDVAEFDQPCCLAQLQNPEEQLAERLQMALAEVADRSEVRRIERDNHHEIVPLAAGSSNAPRRIQPACIAMQTGGDLTFGHAIGGQPQHVADLTHG